MHPAINTVMGIVSQAMATMAPLAPEPVPVRLNRHSKRALIARRTHEQRVRGKLPRRLIRKRELGMFGAF